MFERNIYDLYGLFCENRFFIGPYEGFSASGDSFIVLPKDELFMQEHEMLTVVEYLHTVGDTSVLKPIPTLNGSYVGFVDGQSVYVCLLPEFDQVNARAIDPFDVRSQAEELATLHEQGKLMFGMANNTDFFGKWHILWETRLDQLESWYEQVRKEGPKTDVDEAFLFTFPYFLGLSENAIQFVVDTMIDFPERDMPTICHRRYNERTWLVLSENGEIAKRPTEFVYDHHCRDLAEWIRDKKKEETIETIILFLETYGQKERLTNYGWCLLYARLLFPLHYFETIEHYYRSQVIEKRNEAASEFFTLLSEEGKNEQFLRTFSELMMKQSYELPTVDWL